MPLPKMTAVVLALLLLVAACSGGDDGGDAEEETSSTRYEQPTVALEVRSADLVSTHAVRGPLAADVTSEITEVVERLLLATSAEPLTAGEAGDVAPLFTPDAAAQAAFDDRAAIFDEGLPGFGSLEARNTSIGITALNGAMTTEAALAVVDLQWDVSSTRNPADRVVRTGELSLVRGEDGWKIAAYRLHVERTVGDDTTTTTATTEEAE